MKLIVTGGAGFIGSAVVRRAVGEGRQVVNLDALTYSASLENVASVAGRPGYAFEHADICDAAAVAAVFERHQPDAIMHLGPAGGGATLLVGPAARPPRGLPLPPCLDGRGLRGPGRVRRLQRGHAL